VSFDDDFRRLGGKEIHVVTADVPGASEFDRMQPNTIHRVALRRVPWLKPESLLIYLKLLLKASTLAATLPADDARAMAQWQRRRHRDVPGIA
jgi:phosphatidylinositol alpha-1,6-mannosyltransferase